MSNIFLLALIGFVPVGLIIIIVLESKTKRKNNGHQDYFVGE